MIAGVPIQRRDGITVAENTESEAVALDESRTWFVRLRIRDDRLAKLWVGKLVDHDVIVWSDAEECWKKLLVVPQLRAAVRKATTSAYVRKNAPLVAPPATPALRRPVLDLDDQDLEELPTQVRHPPSYAPSRDDEESPTRVRPPASYSRSRGDDNSPTRVRQPLSYVASRDDEEYPTRVRPRLVSDRPPGPVDPFLHALTTSIPPAVHSNPPPQIPRAPRLPIFHAVDALPEVVPQAYLRLVPKPARPTIRSISQLSIKNISLAMMPVACAGVFALFLQRYADSAGYNSASLRGNIAASSSVSEPATTGTNGEGSAAASWPLSQTCSGKPQLSEPPRPVLPEQLAALPGTRGKALGLAPWAVKSDVSAFAVGRKGGARNLPLAASPGAQTASSTVTDSNEFDREGARTALKYAIARVRNCSNAGLSGAALITFAPSGTVQRVQLGQVQGDDVDPDCVTRALAGARVPPFTGMPVTVRKSF